MAVCSIAPVRANNKQRLKIKYKITLTVYFNEPGPPVFGIYANNIARDDAAECGVSSGAILFADRSFIRPKIKSCVFLVTRPSLNFYPQP